MNAVQFPQGKRVPPGFDSPIATAGIVNAAAISIGVLSRSRMRMLRSSIRV